MDVRKLQDKAREIRLDILDMIMKGGSGHLGGSFSATEILVALYYSKMNLFDDPKDPRRDRFVLSKGHAAPAVYAILLDKGYVDPSEKDRLRQFGSPFQGHPDGAKCPGIDCNTGSLGQGLSVAVGMALGLKRHGSNAKVYVLSGDGELQEGICWEAFMVANQQKLDNLTVIVDRNMIQLSGRTEDISGLGDVAKKIDDFGFCVTECDGNNLVEVLDALDKHEEGKPHCIVAHTIKGKGVSFMEDSAYWHGAMPKGDEIASAYKELGGEYVG